MYENLDTSVAIGTLCDEYSNAVYFGDVIIKNRTYNTGYFDYG
jgi:hypothetical protein